MFACTTLLLAVGGSTIAANASVVSRRDNLAGLSVTFFDDIGLVGKALSPDIVEGQCFNLPVEWQDRPEGVIISTGWSCSFHPYAFCEGTSTVLTGTVATLSSALYNNIQSFCGSGNSPVSLELLGVSSEKNSVSVKF
ncbi:hypothetical protein CVT26_013374 [Gymnopilus dilepis]|uniref:Uncharacterized protein n=1 Tax=Gymnopilus dilepis TaxID=231916 RepID=A0A409VUX7_9AGAR|nr:hypothetical protein CVT26_013374 [Gymnopilus dilepis]